jgi:5-oxoprolinase (ATP-hydrolysing)
MAHDYGISRALIPRYSSILSAYGMAVADVTVENQEPESVTFSSKTSLTSCAKGCERSSRLRGISNIEHELYLNMRYQGSDTPLMIRKPGSTLDFAKAFSERHKQEFGFSQEWEVLVHDITLFLWRTRSKNSRTMSPWTKLRLKGGWKPAFTRSNLKA